MDLSDASSIERALSLVADVLRDRGVGAIEIVVVGGAALNVPGLVRRPTRDVDVLATASPSEPSGPTRLEKCSTLPAALADATAEVAGALGLDPRWLNNGPAALLDHGLPDGFSERLTARCYGTTLVVHFASRTDLIALKVFAAADSGIGRHTKDLATLAPTDDELRAGVRWARTQDGSPEFGTRSAGSWTTSAAR